MTNWGEIPQRIKDRQEAHAGDKFRKMIDREQQSITLRQDRDAKGRIVKSRKVRTIKASALLRAIDDLFPVHDSRLSMSINLSSEFTIGSIIAKKRIKELITELCKVGE